MLLSGQAPDSCYLQTSASRRSVGSDVSESSANLLAGAPLPGGKKGV
jgi:hypothetical protein